MDVNEQYGKFPNGNPEAHTGRGSVNSVGGVNRESLSRTNDLRSADGNKTGAGINNSPSHQNRPPISLFTPPTEFTLPRPVCASGLPLGNFPYCSLTSIYGIPYLSFPLYCPFGLLPLCDTD